MSLTSFIVLFVAQLLADLTALRVSLAEYWFMWRVDWNQVVKEAEDRNAAG